MLYADILARMTTALLDSPNKVKVWVAAPYSPEVVRALEQVSAQGCLGDITLVGDAQKIPNSTQSFKRVNISCADGIAQYVSSEATKVNGLVVKGNISSSTLLKATLSGGVKKQLANHVYIIQGRAFPDRTLLVADAGVNIQPDLKAKAQIINNTIRVAQQVGFSRPKVALVSAVESINPAMQSTLDAAALKVMGERGSFDSAFVDGPMAFDAAMLPSAAAVKGLKGEVAGKAEVLILDDIEASNSTSKALIGADGDAMGVVVGGSGVVAFPSRGDSEKTRCHSLLLAAFLTASEF